MVSASLQAVITQHLFKTRDGRGRVAAFEVMIATPAIRNLIRENKLAQILSVMQTSKGIGMQTMEAACQDLVANKLVSKDEVLFFLSPSQK